MNFFTLLKNFFLAFLGKRSVKKNSCKTKYPIILIHGIGYRDDMAFSSWGKIPEYLKIGGATVYLADTEAWASYADNAKIINEKITSVLHECNVKKVNIIAHSKGGIDARLAIHHYKLDEKVASLTTVSTPHLGTCIADIVTGQISDDSSVLYDAVNCLGKVMGDKHPESGIAGKQLTREYMKKFNKENPNSPDVYYQSYGTEMHTPLDDPLFTATYLILKNYEGDNDGMVSKKSCQWGEFQGVVKTDIPNVGISHSQITGSGLEIVAGKNIPLIYVDWVSKLKDKGF